MAGAIGKVKLARGRFCCIFLCKMEIREFHFSYRARHFETSMSIFQKMQNLGPGIGIPPKWLVARLAWAEVLRGQGIVKFDQKR